MESAALGRVMEITLRIDGDGRRTYTDVTTAERHGYGTLGVRLTFRDGRSEVVPDARIVRASE
jgi:hypothetical protein